MTSQVPEKLRYTKEHEWILIEDDLAICGITDFAQSSLGDIVFIELPEVGTSVEQNSSCGVIESIKSVSDLFVPITGEIIEINPDVVESPEKCNEDPYNSWLIKIKISDTDEINGLLDPTQYNEYIESLS